MHTLVPDHRRRFGGLAAGLSAGLFVGCSASGDPSDAELIRWLSGLAGVARAEFVPNDEDTTDHSARITTTPGLADDEVLSLANLIDGGYDEGRGQAEARGCGHRRHVHALTHGRRRGSAAGPGPTDLGASDLSRAAAAGSNLGPFPSPCTLSTSLRPLQRVQGRGSGANSWA